MKVTELIQTNNTVAVCGLHPVVKLSIHVHRQVRIEWRMSTRMILTVDNWGKDLEVFGPVQTSLFIGTLGSIWFGHFHFGGAYSGCETMEKTSIRFLSIY